METQLYSGLLNDVWQALERIGFAGHEGAEGALGWITAVSVDGSRLRVLLRVTRRSCRKGERELRDVDEVIRAIPTLAEVEVLSKPYVTAMSTMSGSPRIQSGTSPGGMRLVRARRRPNKLNTVGSSMESNSGVLIPRRR